MATWAERMRALRERRLRGGAVRGDCIDRGRGPGEIAEAGYTHVLGDDTPAVAGAQQIHTDTIACLSAP
jgi:hypothetical protein